jgi:hypothetical protein
MEKVTDIFVAARIGLVGNAVNLAAYAVRKAKDLKNQPVRRYSSPWSRDRRI